MKLKNEVFQTYYIYYDNGRVRKLLVLASFPLRDRANSKLMEIKNAMVNYIIFMPDNALFCLSYLDDDAVMFFHLN